MEGRLPRPEIDRGPAPENGGIWVNITDIITLVGAIATFLFGMSTMTDGLEKLSSGRLEGILERPTSNVVKGCLLYTSDAADD